MPPVKRKSFTLQEKLQVIQQRKNSVLSGRAFSKSVGINEATIRLWMSKEETLGTFKDSAIVRKARKVPRKRIGFHPELDRLVHSWVKDRNDNGIRVKDRFIMMRAKQVRDELLAAGAQSGGRQALKDFEASKLWCHRFKQRYQLGSRRHTTSHRLPVDFRQQSVEFIRKVHRLCTEHNIQRGEIINFDQVPRYFEAARSTTITTKGSKEVLLGKCGNSHKRFTFTPFIGGSGRILIKHALFSKLAKIPKHNENCRVSVNETGMWNESVLKNNINEAIRLSRGLFNNNKPLLFILDSYGVHVKFVRLNEEHYKSMNVFFAVIPPGLTGILQPLDVAINRSFQQRFNDRTMEYQSESLANGTNKTPQGNIKMPNTELVTTWIVEWCESISADLISKAFDLCGLVPVDEFKHENLHKPLQDIYDDSISVELWLNKHATLLEANQLDYDGKWDFFSDKHAFFKALRSITDSAEPTAKWVAEFTGKVNELLSEDPLTATLFTREDKKIIEEGTFFTHGRLEVYAASELFKSQFHLISVNAADIPTDRIVFGAHHDGEPIAFFFKNDPLVVMTPDAYDPSAAYFVEDVEAGASEGESGEKEKRNEDGSSDDSDNAFEEHLEEENVSDHDWTQRANEEENRVEDEEENQVEDEEENQEVIFEGFLEQLETLPDATSATNIVGDLREDEENNNLEGEKLLDVVD